MIIIIIPTWRLLSTLFTLPFMVQGWSLGKGRAIFYCYWVISLSWFREPEIILLSDSTTTTRETAFLLSRSHSSSIRLTKEMEVERERKRERKSATLKNEKTLTQSGSARNFTSFGVLLWKMGCYIEKVGWFRFTSVEWADEGTRERRNKEKDMDEVTSDFSDWASLMLGKRGCYFISTFQPNF